MTDITENDVTRSIRPAEAVKAWERIYQSREVIRAGAAAKVRSLHDWIKVIGPFVHERINKAKAITGTTRGTIYSAELKKQMGQFYPIFKKQSDNGAISFLMNIMDNLQAVEAWLETLPKDERPHHPNRVWPAYEASRMKVVTFKDEAPADLVQPDTDAEEDNDDVDDDDAGDDGEDEDDDKPTKKKRARRSKEEKDAAQEHRIELLEQELGKYRLSADPALNASRIWLALQDVVGPKPAFDLGRATTRELTQLLDRIEGMWQEMQEAS